MKQIFGLILPTLLIFACSSCNVNIDTKDTAHIDDALSELDSLQTETTSLQIMKKTFGKADQKQVFIFTLTNSAGMEVKITNYGGIITSITMPDKKGHSGDIVLGYDSLGGYIANSPYFGALVGRYANRIASGSFVLKGKTYKLAINNGKNSLHGGSKGFDKVVWDAKEIKDSTQGIFRMGPSKEKEGRCMANIGDYASKHSIFRIRPTILHSQMPF